MRTQGSTRTRNLHRKRAIFASFFKGQGTSAQSANGGGLFSGRPRHASPVLYTNPKESGEQWHAPFAEYLRSGGSAGGGAAGVCGVEFRRRCAPACATGLSQPEPQCRDFGECRFVLQARIGMACVLDECGRFRRAAAYSVDSAPGHQRHAVAVSSAPTFAVGPADGFRLRERSSFSVHIGRSKNSEARPGYAPCQS